MKNEQHKNFLVAFGCHLKSTRKRLGFSQEKLAYESGVELRHIGRIERGEINTGIASVKILALTMNIKMKELFDFEYYGL